MTAEENAKERVFPSSPRVLVASHRRIHLHWRTCGWFAILGHVAPSSTRRRVFHRVEGVLVWRRFLAVSTSRVMRASNTLFSDGSQDGYLNNNVGENDDGPPSPAAPRRSNGIECRRRAAVVHAAYGRDSGRDRVGYIIECLWLDGRSPPPSPCPRSRSTIQVYGRSGVDGGQYSDRETYHSIPEMLLFRGHRSIAET